MARIKRQLEMRHTVGKNKLLLLMVVGLIVSALILIFGLSIRTYAEDGTVPVYLTQDPSQIDISIDDEPSMPDQPKTYDEGIWKYSACMVICVVCLIGTIYTIKHNQKESNEK